MTEETVKGGVRARGAVPKQLTRENTEDVSPSELARGDMVLHEKYRGPLTINAVTTDEATGTITLSTDRATWMVGPTAIIRRIITETEESA